MLIDCNCSGISVFTEFVACICDTFEMLEDITALIMDIRYYYWWGNALFLRKPISLRKFYPARNFTLEQTLKLSRLGKNNSFPSRTKYNFFIIYANEAHIARVLSAIALKWML